MIYWHRWFFFWVPLWVWMCNIFIVQLHLHDQKYVLIAFSHSRSGRTIRRQFMMHQVILCAGNINWMLLSFGAINFTISLVERKRIDNSHAIECESFSIAMKYKKKYQLIPTGTRQRTTTWRMLFSKFIFYKLQFCAFKIQYILDDVTVPLTLLAMESASHTLSNEQISSKKNWHKDSNQLIHHSKIFESDLVDLVFLDVAT